MRKPILLFLLATVPGCQDAMADTDAVIPDFLDTATALECERVDLGLEAAPSELRVTSDTTWTLLDAPQLQFLTFSDDFRLLRRTPLPATGPGAAGNAVSAAPMGDTAVVVAVRDGLKLVFLTPAGELMGSVPLEFIPNALAVSGEDVLVTPMAFGSRPPTLLMRYGTSGWRELPVPKRAYTDMSINALGNSALVERMPDGRALLVHQFFRPRAFLVDGAGRVEPRTPPTPDATREHIEYVPNSPMTEEEMARTLVPAMAMSVDPRSGDVYLLTRSGRTVRGRPERAVLRADEGLEFIEGYILPVHATSLAYLPRRNGIVTADAEDAFHFCRFPVAGVAGDPTA